MVGARRGGSLSRILWGLGLLLGGGAAPLRAFELPGLGELLGTRNPLEAFPAILPPNTALRVQAAARDLYHGRQGPRRHGYSLWNLSLLGLARTRGGWLGLRLETDRMDLLQREVHGEEDALDGGRESDHAALAVAAARAPHEIRLLIGGSGGVELAGELRTRCGALTSLQVRGWLWRSGFHVSQRIHETTFFFPFAYRDETAELELQTRPFGRVRLHGRARREVVVGEKPHPEQYNLIYVARWAGEAGLELVRGPRIDTLLRVERAEVGLAMALDGTRYAQANDLRLSRHLAELGWRPARRVRLAAGHDRRTLRSDDPSYLDIWPFTIWDIFAATRYRLESLDFSWGMAYARLSWQACAAKTFSLDVDGRFEWWEEGGTLRWKKRVPVLPPFFFRFDHKTNALRLGFRYGAQLDLRLRWRASPGVSVLAQTQAVAPLGRRRAVEEGEGGGRPPPPGPPTRAHGGLLFRLSIEAAR